MAHGHEHTAQSTPEAEAGLEAEPEAEDIEAELTSRERWDARYRTKPSLWSGKPNVTLVSEAASLIPGAALDVGAGEGADSIWLAQQGWSVTGVDISAVALERAAAHAASAGPDVADRITWECRDILDWQPPERAYDLVTVHYIHLPSRLRRVIYPQFAAAVAPGGTLLVAAHHPSDLETTAARPPYPDLFFTGDDLIADIGRNGWEIVTNAAVPREATDPDGNITTIHDTVLRARRV